MLIATNRKYEKHKMTKQKILSITFKIAILGIIIFGLYFRLHAINFGLPHCFHADEPEIVELAVKYTYQIKSVLKEKDFYKLVPISFVYGMFPTYSLTFATIAFSKTANLLSIDFDKQAIYVFLRIITAVLSLGLIPITIQIYKRAFGKISKIEMGILIFLTALNWKFIVLSHYVNMDIFLTILLNLTLLSASYYLGNTKKSIFVWLTGLLFGFSIGTKITAGLSLPLFIYLFTKRKDSRSLFGFLFLTYIGFAVSNPFSLIFIKDFVFRILEMYLKEGGIVFDSINSNPFKYILSLVSIATPIVFVTSLYGKVETFVHKKIQNPFQLFLFANILIYIAFFSLNSREVDRWLLPIIPAILIFSAKGFAELRKLISKKAFIWLLLVTIPTYLYYPLLTLKQFNRNTPKSEAYLWLRDNVPQQANKLAITEEGLDPLNKLQGIRVKRPNVYSTENARFDFPPSPIGYDYIILSSKPMRNFKRKEVREKYPFYTQKWQEFENTVENPKYFVLEKEFTLPKPNLVNLSDVYIYKRAEVTTNSIQ